MSSSLGKLRAFSLANLYSAVSLCFSREALLYCFPPESSDFCLHLSNIEKECMRGGLVTMRGKRRQFNRAEMGAMAMTSTQLDISALVPNLALKTAIYNWCDEWGLKNPNTPDTKTGGGVIYS
ncbi:hypothetical protein AMTRI_Chr09g38650 [Amborella trichopoda]|uniref:Uncharacterized protein n=1 Tax=Amborella trichopoda TaxID=13333 RepID=W1PKB7_AMBTC|nr:hypothetical protein AMTR_s00152p00017090 [Amborella trichopoda]